MADPVSKTTDLRVKDRPQFSELLWDLIDNSDVDVSDLIAELDDATSCLMHRDAVIRKIIPE